MAAEKEETAMAVIGKDNALTGPIPELVQAFDQIGANLAALQLNGWDQVQKCKAACWLAHGAKIHPAIFMQNNYAMVVKGKLMVEPTWQFVVAVLESRVKGFKMEIPEDEDNAVTVVMSAPGKATQKYRYTLDDAKRQGLMSRDNAWTAGNTREMCFAKAVKRCGRRFSPGALLDLPTGETPVEMEVVENGQPAAADPKAALDAAIDNTRKNVTDVPYTEAAPAEPAKPAPKGETPKARLARVLMEHYGGKLKPEHLAEKASFIYNEMMKAKTGVDPGVQFKKGEVGPVEAAQIADYLEARKAGGKGEPESRNDQEVATPDPTEPPADDEAPPMEEPEQETRERTKVDAYEDLWMTVQRARTIFGKATPPRTFIVEHPPESKKFWFRDISTLREVGLNGALLLQKEGDVVVEMGQIDQLNKILTAMCDKAERGGR